MSTTTQTFQRKNTLYYISLLVYVIFFVVYILFTATITDDTIMFGFRDPVFYIIGIFILHAVVMLLVNVARNQRLIIEPGRIVVKTRYSERVIPTSQIVRIVLRHERRNFYDGTYAVIKLRVVNRRRWLRIRASNWDREHELYALFQAMKQNLKK